MNGTTASTSTLANPPVEFDAALKPRTWREHIGQARMKRILSTQIKAANDDFRRLGHVLLIGASGTGKSSLAKLIAQETNDTFIEIMITPNFKMSSLHRLILGLDDSETYVILLDEVHCLKPAQQHYLYSILQEGVISDDTGKQTPIEASITFILATTHPQKLEEALANRVDITHRFAKYSNEEMAEIVASLAKRLDVEIDETQAAALGKAAAGTPRQARTLVLAARDLGTADPEAVFDMCGITEDGLTTDHVAYLQTLQALGDKGGIANIENHSGRSKESLFKLEKLLIDKEFITIGGKGRVLMATGKSALRRALKQIGDDFL